MENTDIIDVGTNKVDVNPLANRQFNRKELRRAFGGARRGRRSNAPRNIASRKSLPIPIGWEGWKDWKPTKKKTA